MILQFDGKDRLILYELVQRLQTCNAEGALIIAYEKFKKNQDVADYME